MADVVVQPVGGASKKEHRRILSRANAGAIQMVEIDPADDCCMICKVPLFTPQEVKDQLKESAYVYVMENRIEWNRPAVVQECRGVCPTCRVDDNVNVFYWDQPYVKNIRHEDSCLLRFCVKCQTCTDGDIITMSDNHCIDACKAAKMMPGSLVPSNKFAFMVARGQGEACAAKMTQFKLEALNRMGMQHS